MINQETRSIASAGLPPYTACSETNSIRTLGAFGAQHQDHSQHRLLSDSSRVSLQDVSDRTIPTHRIGRYQEPVECICPSCSRRTTTNIEHKSGIGTHTWAGLLFLTTGVGVVVPYMMDYFKNVQHKCGNCGVVLATNPGSSTCALPQSQITPRLPRRHSSTWQDWTPIVNIIPVC